MNLPIIEIFNLLSNRDVSIKVRLSRSVEHYLMHAKVAISNITNVIFEPYNANANSDSDTEYDTMTRTYVIVKDEGVSWISPTTRFLLLSHLELDQNVINNLERFAQNIINDIFVSFTIFNSGIQFKNIRFQDDYTTTKFSDAVLFRTYKLERKMMSFEYVDFKVLSSIMTTRYPMNFKAQNIKIIDYQNMNKGFLFETQCNYEGASVHGEITFDQFTFVDEDVTMENKFKSGSFLSTYAPVNITISNSDFRMHHRVMEDFEVFRIEDSGNCSPNDNIIQYISFVNNSMTFNNANENVFNNILVSSNGANQRYREIILENNMFYNMKGAVKEFIQIDYNASGIIKFLDNTMVNCSCTTSFIEIYAQDEIILENNKFDSIIARSKGLIITDRAELVRMTGLEVTKVEHNTSDLPEPLIKLSTKLLGNAIFENSTFHSNYVKTTAIEFDETVGSIVFRNNVFYYELIKSLNNYITIDKPYEVKFTNTTFKDMSDDKSTNRLTQLIMINSFNLNIPGNFEMDNIIATNCSLSFFSLTNLDGKATEPQLILYDNIVFKDATFDFRNDIITFGPLVTKEDVEFRMQFVEFSNINCRKGSSLIRIYQQSKYPITIDSCVFKDIIGGYITMEPPSIDPSQPRASLEMKNVTVQDNDFKFATFFMLEDYCQLEVSNCTMNRNSGYFRGSIATIEGDDSFANFRDCGFNNNVAVLGGLFYVSKRSVINIHNSALFNNFGITAGLAYVANQGSIILDSCEISRNQALTVGLVEVINSMVDSEIRN